MVVLIPDFLCLLGLSRVLALQQVRDGLVQRHAHEILSGELLLQLCLCLEQTVSLVHQARARGLRTQALFLDTRLGTHTLTMSRDVSDIHGDPSGF